jgi:hypothetical protein
MTMLLHTHSPFERAPASIRSKNTIEASTAATRAAAMKRFFIGALTVFATASALTAVIALKAAIYYWRFH